MDIQRLQKKLAILKSGSLGTGHSTGTKSRKERLEFWSDMMDNAAKESDKLKASELLGKASADFTEKVEHSGAGGGPIQVAPMDTAGLKRAIRSQQTLRLPSS
jgi:hypothetical protein